jgi:cytochrome P450
VVQDMPYLQAVVHEGLRLYPPSVGTQDKLTPPEGDFIHGVRLPGGVDVGQNLGCVLRDAQLFGPDVDVFRPGRWLEAAVDDKADGGQRYKRLQAAVDLVFGCGRYQCLGKGIVWTIVPKVIFEVSSTSAPPTCDLFDPSPTDIILPWLHG